MGGWGFILFCGCHYGRGAKLLIRIRKVIWVIICHEGIHLFKEHREQIKPVGFFSTAEAGIAAENFCYLLPLTLPDRLHCMEGCPAVLFNSSNILRGYLRDDLQLRVPHQAGYQLCKGFSRMPFLQNRTQ